MKLTLLLIAMCFIGCTNQQSPTLRYDLNDFDSFNWEKNIIEYEYYLDSLQLPYYNIDYIVPPIEQSLVYGIRLDSNVYLCGYKVDELRIYWCFNTMTPDHFEFRFNTMAAMEIELNVIAKYNGGLDYNEKFTVCNNDDGKQIDGILYLLQYYEVLILHNETQSSILIMLNQ